MYGMDAVVFFSVTGSWCCFSGIFDYAGHKKFRIFVDGKNLGKVLQFILDASLELQVACAPLNIELLLWLTCARLCGKMYYKRLVLMGKHWFEDNSRLWLPCSVRKAIITPFSGSIVNCRLGLCLMRWSRNSFLRLLILVKVSST